MYMHLKIKKIERHVSDIPTQYYDVIEASPHHNFFIKTKTGAVCSHNCLASFFDEIDKLVSA